MKTNAMRLLEEANIGYEVVTYKVDEKHLDALSVAKMTNLEEGQVFKTIVCRNEIDKIFVFLVPGPLKIDLKAACRLGGSKKIELVENSELRSLTGYIRGGVSPLAMRRVYPLFLERAAEKYATIAVSGGLRGVQLLLSPSDLLGVTGGIYGEFST
ncbi:MAG: Cys-tRNA(Pro) deacylase [Sphaerochaetaceae bacterium]|jgi:Cys-tRNA(Pro)/Cys-tRNA(Cys) deacylase|nr:Cys-tRNA(Pro) deacylase [Sphaerochaetaceae bacterium]